MWEIFNFIFKHPALVVNLQVWQQWNAAAAWNCWNNALLDSLPDQCDCHASLLPQMHDYLPQQSTVCLLCSRAFPYGLHASASCEHHKRREKLYRWWECNIMARYCHTNKCVEIDGGAGVVVWGALARLIWQCRKQVHRNLLCCLGSQAYWDVSEVAVGKWWNSWWHHHATSSRIARILSCGCI